MDAPVLRIVVDLPSIGTNSQAERLFLYHQNPLFQFQRIESKNIEMELPSFDRLNNSILLTENKELLGKRVHLKRSYPHITVVGSRECMEIMELYAKKMDKCFLSPTRPVSRSTWYFVQSRSAFSYFHFPNSQDAAATRFMCLLKALDYMGILFYSAVNSNTLEDTTYHFNYFVILVSGVFDTLAILTKNHLKISFDHDNIPSRISLSNDSGKDFLSAIKEVNIELWNHIIAHRIYIELVYAFRDQLIHRDTIPTVALNYSGGMERRDLAIMDVQGEVVMRLKECKGFENDLRNAPMTNWGVYSGFGSVGSNPKSLWISPYVFAKAATKNLITFTNEYMRRLGFTDSLASGGTGWPFDEVKAIRTTGLGLVNSWN
jgi:hypothetical protein